VGTTYGLSATFSDTASGGSPWRYDIDWGDGERTSGTKSSISPITATHLYAAEGNYRVTVSVTNQRDETGSGSVTVAATAPVILAAGDIADCTRFGDDSTAMLLDALPGVVIPLGDNAYANGTPDEYTNCYGPTWGRQKARTRPVAGNHDYNTPAAPGYFGYFGAAGGDPAKGYYSFTLGSWFVIVLNTGTDVPSNYEAGSPQEQWLRSELASHTQPCVLAVFHHPRFSTVKDRAPITYYTAAIWNALYAYGADLVLNGHDHAYQRFAPQRPDGTRDTAFGIRQIAVGTGGGEVLYVWADSIPAGSNIEVRDNQTHGVLKVTLRAGSYEWRFVPASGASFTDSGSGSCHGSPL
jgi:PKD repeat protein